MEGKAECSRLTRRGDGLERQLGLQLELLFGVNGPICQARENRNGEGGGIRKFALPERTTESMSLTFF